MTQAIQTSRRWVLSSSAVGLASLPDMFVCDDDSAATRASRATKPVLEHHLGAFAKGLDQRMQDD